MHSGAKWIAVFGILLLAVALPGTSHAGPKEEARKHFERGVELVDDEQLAEAIVEFQRAYELTRHFAVLYNIAQVYASLAKPVEAVDAYERYLSEGAKSIKPARRQEVEQEIARQKTRIATLEFRGLPDGAVVRVDGKEIGKSPIAEPFRLGVGTHVVAASADGYDAAEKSLDVAGEDRKIVELVLTKRAAEAAAPVMPVLIAPAGEPVATPVPVPPAPVVLPTPAPPAESLVSVTAEPTAKPKSLGGLRIAGIITGAAGVIGMGAGTACWLVARSRHNEAVTNWTNGPEDKAQSQQSEAKDYALAGNISFAAGAAMTALGAVLYIVGSQVSDSPATAHTMVTPVLGHDFAGAAALGRW